MNTFRALCFAAAMGLVVTCAFPQGRGRGNDDKGGQSSGGSSRGSSGGDVRSKGDDRGKSDGGGSRGSGNSGGSSSSGVSSGQGRSDGGRGRGDNGGGTTGGPTQGSGSTSGQGRSDGGRGRGDNGGGTTGGPTQGSGSTSGGSTGGSGRGSGSGVGSSGGAGQRGDGDIGRGGRGGTNSNGDTRGSGSGNSNAGDRGGSGSGSIGRGGSSGSGNSNGGGTFGGGSNGSGGTRGGWGQGGNNGGPTTIGNNRDGVRDSLLGRKSSHSGTVHYNGSNNVATTTRVGGATIIGRAPVNIHNIGRDSLINRKDHPSLHSGGYRTGYYFYDPRWCDDYFWYPYYSFDPWSRRCVVSPWYYYAMLPGYVSWDRCHFYNLSPWSVWVGTSYQWQRPAYYGNSDNWGQGRASEADYAVDDIVNAFERSDRRAVGRLVSDRSEVSIYIDGNYSYTLNADDFYDMFMDATQNTRTRRYTIERVERGRDQNRNECYRVTARHEYEDPWGARTSVTHFYELGYEGRNLVITKFGVSGGN